MGDKLAGLEPASVFEYFEAISAIPRRSGNEKELSDYMVAFAEERGLKALQDEFMNVIIWKSATKGYETSDPVIIQGHLDMVCQKTKDSSHDFDRDGLDLIVDGDLIKANGTTLGADNGIALAYAMALLDADDIPHPPLEVVYTTDEEVGLTGALKMDKSPLQGKYFINLDSEEEGEITVGCAGGLHGELSVPLAYEDTPFAEPIVAHITVEGLKGGHSGVDILNFRANASRIMGRVLGNLFDRVDIRLLDIKGGDKDNVITRESSSFVVLEKKDFGQLERVTKAASKAISEELKTGDPDLSIRVRTPGFTHLSAVLDKTSTEKVIFLLFNLPNGVQTMSADLPGMAESSLNIGKVAIENGKAIFLFALRSSVKSLKYHMTKQLEWFAKFTGGQFTPSADYPEWPFKKDSRLTELAVSKYEALYGKRPLVKAIHAGLEPGVFLEKMPEVDAISFGPDMWDVHSPAERLSIASTGRTWILLKEILASLK